MDSDLKSFVFRLTTCVSKSANPAYPHALNLTWYRAGRHTPQWGGVDHASDCIT